jgi:hypothetical protein
MQRVVRNTLVGLLTIAGLTACGDKVTGPQNTTSSGTVTPVVRSVTVSPASLNLNPGDKATLAASVNADAGITDRTVTWSTSDATIATVDATSGLVTAVKAGNVTITAAAKADLNVKGAASVTVGGGVTVGAPATITISTINTTRCDINGGCTSVPANLGNVNGQIDVTVNVDPGNARLVGVDLIMNCSGNGNSGADTVIATQSLASANVAPSAAEAASAPVTMSFNTASFNSTTGATAFKNGQCTLKARARTNLVAGGPITTTTSTAQTFTLNNLDVVIGSISSTKSAINPVTGLVWNGGDVTVTATPVLFSGRTAASTLNITFECRTVAATANATGQLQAVFTDANDGQTNPCTGAAPVANNGSGVVTATGFVGNTTPALNDIDNITDPAAVATFSLTDSNGQPVNSPVTCGGAGNGLCSSQSVLANPAAPTAVASIRLDTQRPAAGTLNLASNTFQNTTAGGYIGGNFRFVPDSASGFRGANTNSASGVNSTCLGSASAVNPVTCNFDNGGVDSVTVIFQSATSRTGTRTTITNSSGLAESATNATFNLIQITTDRLGNADTSYVVSNGTAQVEFSSTTTIPLSARFGVDKTAPALTLTAGVPNQTRSQVLGGTGAYFFSIRDTSTGGAAPSGPAPQALVAQVRQIAGLTTGTTLPASGSVFTNGSESNAGNAGCVIGLFNRGATAPVGSTNSLPVLANDGTVVGTCTPTLYTLSGGTGIQANFQNTVSAYVTTRVIAIDQAGNQSAPFTNIVVEDASNPTAGPIDAPTTIAGGSSPTFAAAATDNLDVVGGLVQLNYPTVAMILQYPVVAGPGAAFDNVLTTSGKVSPQVQVFLRNLQTSTAAQPTGQVAAQAPNTVNVASIDEVNRTGQTGMQTLSLFSSFTQPSGSQGAGASTNVFSSNFNGGFTISNTSNTTLSDCPAGGCAGGAAPSNPTSTTFTATAAGVTGVLTNPFTTVQFWYQVNGAGPWFLAGTATNSGVRDTGVGGQRFFDYTFTFTPPATAPIDPATSTAASLTGGATLNFRAIGADSNGDGIVSSNTQAVTLTNP